MNKMSIIGIIALVGLLFAQNSSHTVQKGDNLWNLAVENFGDGYEWRQIWDKNSQIENPDLIYPGDQLVIRGGQVSVARVDGTVDQVGTTTYASDTTLSFDELTRGLFGDDSIAIDSVEKVSSTVPDSLNGKQLTPQERLILGLTSSEMNAELLAYAQGAFRVQQRAVPFAYDPEVDSVAVPVGIIDDKTRHMYIPYQKVRIRFDTVTTYPKNTKMDVYSKARKLKHSGSKYEILVPVATGTFIKSSDDTAIVELVEVYGEVRNKDYVTISRTYPDFSQIEISKVKDSVIEMELVAHLSTGASIKPFSYVVVGKGSEEGVELGDIVQGYSVSKEGAADYFPKMVGVVQFVGAHVSTVHIVKVMDLTTDEKFLFKRVGRITYR